MFSVAELATLLTDLGATQGEVHKAMPKASDIAATRKRKADAEMEARKRQKKDEVSVTLSQRYGMVMV